MNGKTIEEIRREYSEKATALMNARFARTDEIANLRAPGGDPYYMSKMTNEQQRMVLHDQKQELAERNRDELRREFVAAHERYARDVAERTAYLHRRLFGAEGADSAMLLARAATASEDELKDMLGAASQAKNSELGKIVFAAAHRRGLGDAMVNYFAEMDPEARELYAEFHEAPSEETIAKQAADIDSMIPPASPEQLAGTPPVYS